MGPPPPDLPSKNNLAQAAAGSLFGPALDASTSWIGAADASGKWLHTNRSLREGLRSHGGGAVGTPVPFSCWQLHRGAATVIACPCRHFTAYPRVAAMFCQTAPIQVPERIASQPFDIAGPGARLVVIEPVRGASESALAATPRALELLEALRGELAPREELGGQRLLRPPTTTLSQREWEIVQKLMACHRLTEVSKDLGISIHTARNHLKSVFRKLGVRSQSELVQAILSGRA